MPVLHLIAGPSGAGKTVLRQVLVAPRYPQLPVLEGRSSAIVLARAAERRPQASPTQGAASGPWHAHLTARTSFVLETTFDPVADLALITEARRREFQVVLYALDHDEPDRLHERVAPGRHDRGGRHPGAQDDQARARDADALRKALFVVDLAFLFDASDASRDGPRLVASVASGRMQLHTLVRPRWVDRALGFAER
jgi:predicted ABC-type ATPase